MADDEADRARVLDAVALLRNKGYLVVKIPECKFGERDHGAHVLITRSAKCPGGGTIPHGYQGTHLGTFGMWVHCRCGGSYSHYLDDRPTEWEKHQAENPKFFEQSTKES